MINESLYYSCQCHRCCQRKSHCNLTLVKYCIMDASNEDAGAMLASQRAAFSVQFCSANTICQWHRQVCSTDALWALLVFSPAYICGALISKCNSIRAFNRPAHMMDPCNACEVRLDDCHGLFLALKSNFL